TAAGVEVLLATAVDDLETSGPGARVVRCGEQRIEAEAVIVTTPPEAAAALVGGDALGPVERLGASPIVNVHLVLDRRVSDLEMFACVRSPVQFVFDRTESAHFGDAAPPLEGEQCLSISLSGADADIGRRPEELISSYFAALAEVLPAARSARLVDAVVSRERLATFRAVPGTAGLRPAVTTPIDRVLVAGAWCDTGWPATMEGAVRSGRAAAAAALDRIGGSGADHELEAVAS
ncbi:MAG: FAD-dependent oxidoreductase, partial [Acidimicrobiales bacterium]